MLMKYMTRTFYHMFCQSCILWHSRESHTLYSAARTRNEATSFSTNVSHCQFHVPAHVPPFFQAMQPQIEVFRETRSDKIYKYIRTTIGEWAIVMCVQLARRQPLFGEDLYVLSKSLCMVLSPKRSIGLEQFPMLTSLKSTTPASLQISQSHGPAGDIC